MGSGTGDFFDAFHAQEAALDTMTRFRPDGSVIGRYLYDAFGAPTAVTEDACSSVPLTGDVVLQRGRVYASDVGVYADFHLIEDVQLGVFLCGIPLLDVPWPEGLTPPGLWPPDRPDHHLCCCVISIYEGGQSIEKIVFEGQTTSNGESCLHRCQDLINEMNGEDSPPKPGDPPPPVTGYYRLESARPGACNKDGPKLEPGKPDDPCQFWPNWDPINPDCCNKEACLKKAEKDAEDGFDQCQSGCLPALAFGPGSFGMCLASCTGGVLIGTQIRKLLCNLCKK